MTHGFPRQDGLSGDFPGTSCDQRFLGGFKEDIIGRFEAETKPC